MACAASILLAAPAAQAATVQEVIQNFGLIGVFAVDCSKPASAQNSYVVQRAVDAEHVQRDLMIGPAARQNFYVVDRAEVAKPNEVAISMTSEGRRLNLLLRAEPKRMRTIESAPENGAKLIADGRFVDNGAQTPWLNKCE
jgi:hypothetical protein